MNVVWMIFWQWIVLRRLVKNQVMVVVSSAAAASAVAAVGNN
jgi:hypothetical protein